MTFTKVFKYLGRVVAYDDTDVPAARRQLSRARAVWGRLRKVIAQEDVPAPVAGMFYQAVVAAVLLYGSESWVLPDAAMARLEGFHVECARRLTGMRPRKHGGTWVYPKSADVLRAARLRPLRHYIQKRRATVATTIGERPILEECRGAARLRGSPVRTTWWEQDLSLPPEPEEEDDGEPGRGGKAGPPWEGRSSRPDRRQRRPQQQEASAEEQRAARRAEEEVKDPEAEEELERRWAEAHLPAGLV